MTRRRLRALSIAIPTVILSLGVFVHRIVVPYVRLESRFRKAGDPSISIDTCQRLLREMREIRPDLETYLIGKARLRSLDDIRRVTEILRWNPGLDRARLWDAHSSTFPTPKAAAEPWVDALLTLYLELLVAKTWEAGPELDEVHAEALQLIAYWTSFPHQELYWTELYLEVSPLAHFLANGSMPLNPQELASKLPSRSAELTKVCRKFADWVRAGAGHRVFGLYGAMGDDGRPVRLGPYWYEGETRIGFCSLEEQAPRQPRFGGGK